jgi:outer membrane lipoprotein carrier protein
MIKTFLVLFPVLISLIPVVGTAMVKSKTELLSATGAKVLKETSRKYRTTKLVKIETNKKVTSELMGRTTNYKGVIYLSQGKFRWENETPDETLLMFDGETIWNVQYPPKDLGGQIQVARAKLTKTTKSQILISTLIGKESIDKNFEVINEKTVDNILIIELKPLTSDLRVKDLNLSIDPKDKIILKISYKDDVDNLTVVELKNTEFLKKENSGLFKYEIPKDSQVTNL